MSLIVPYRSTGTLLQRHTEYVVPTDAATAAFDYDGTYGAGPTGPADVGAFVDKYIIPDLNATHGPGGRLERTSIKLGGRAIHLLLTTSSLLATAPAAVLTLAAGLASATPESYVIWSQALGDCWLVARRGEGLRHAAFGFMRRAGARYFGAHPAWKRLTKGPIYFDASELVQPTIRDFVIAPNGGLGGGNVTFAGPLQDKQYAATQNWWDWFAQNRLPREWNGPTSDGLSGFTYYKQRELAHDRTMGAYDATIGERLSGGVPNSGHFPSVCQPISYSFYAKHCTVHHGQTSGGAYPARPGTATPWTTAPNTPSGPTTTVGVAFPDPDPNPDADNTPQPTDYSSFGGAVKLVAEHLRDYSAANINTFGPDSPNVRWVSINPNDGPGQCTCTKSKNLLRNGPYAAWLTPTQQTQDASLSDGAWHSVNVTQAFLEYWYGTRTDGRPAPGCALSAYSDHTAPPSIPIAQNSLVYYAVSSSGTNLLTQEVATAWSAKRAANPWGAFTLGIFPAWLISNSTYDMPRLSPRAVAAYVKTWIAENYTGLAPQTTVSNFSIACAYYVAAALAWDPAADVEALITEWFTVFGSAATAIRAMLERHWQWFELSAHEVGQCFRDIQTAQAALDANPATTASEQACLDHAAAWVQWLRLYLEYSAALAAYTATPNPTTLAAYDAATDAGINWLWKIQYWNVVQADRLAKALYTPIPGSETTLIAKWNTGNAGAAGWALVAEQAHSDITTVVTSGVSGYPLLTGVTRKSFSKTLVPYTTSTDSTLIWTPECDAPQIYQFVKGSADITFAIKQQGIAVAGRVPLPFRILVQDLSGTTLQEIQQLSPDPLLGPVTTMHTITVAPGTYLLQVVDLTDNLQQARIAFARKVPIVLLSARFNREFDQSPFPDTHLYFYVPLGTTRLSCVYNSFEPIQFYLPGGSAQTTNTEGLYSRYCDVPTGQDGRVWSLTKIRVGQTAPSDAALHLEGCPENFALDPSQMMVPSGLDGF